jgi:ferredoxin-like protein FixX
MVQWELDSFYFKFKNLLRAEKDATLTFKSEAGRAFVTLSLDLGHVLSEQDQLPPSGHRNGPARQRRREKRAAARIENLSAENVEVKDKESAEEVEEDPSNNNSTAEEAKRVESAVKANELSNLEKETAEKVEVPVKDLKDEVCPDEIYQNQSKTLISVETQTLECGVAPTAASKSVFDYTLRYDDPVF